MNQQPPPNYAPPRLPPRPLTERESAPLGKDELDGYDRMMAPERVTQAQRRKKFFA